MKLKSMMLAPLFAIAGGMFFSCAFSGPDILLDSEVVEGKKLSKYVEKYWVSSTLEASDDGDMAAYAMWMGWKIANLFDGVISAVTPNVSDSPSCGWSSADKDLPQWVIIDFGVPVVPKKVILYARTDDWGSYGNPGANFPQAFEIYLSNDGQIPDAAETGDPSDTASYWDSSSVSIDSSTLLKPPKSDPGLSYELDNTDLKRYLMLKVTRATGDFVQLSELEVYGEFE
ncbi:MAG: discoidin domain-containing protein [Spirochaetales bacterium]|nr:discoidin domain-containing protein [Spirochaetales bacterium]